MTLSTESPFSRCILTYDPTAPVLVHVMVCTVPVAQLSSPFGAVTVNEKVSPVVTVKSVSLVSVIVSVACCYIVFAPTDSARNLFIEIRRFIYG